MRVLITAGPTREAIDAVRFIGNRSSGRMGIELARAALAAGHDVTLLLGPVAESSPAGVKSLSFTSTSDLEKLLVEHWPSHDLLIMAAAVADYRPSTVVSGKLPRQADGSFVLTLTPTPDLVATLAKQKSATQRIIAFALEEPAQLETRAMEKMKRKHVDAIVANPLDTMDATTINPTWLTASGQRVAPGQMSKAQFAPWLMTRAEALMASPAAKR
jgi:phosphopantothenoylcysteine decarboxylase/phosphopantothenate--cysteine ligase